MFDVEIHDEEGNSYYRKFPYEEVVNGMKSMQEQGSYMPVYYASYGKIIGIRAFFPRLLVEDYTDESDGAYWLATPAGISYPHDYDNLYGYQTSDLYCVSGGKLGSWMYDINIYYQANLDYGLTTYWRNFGVRPVVCLKAGTHLEIGTQFSEDIVYNIVKD